MESNRDDADRCKAIALDAFRQGDFPKALRFLEKAQRLCPSDEIEVMIKEVQDAGLAKEGMSTSEAKEDRASSEQRQSSETGTSRDADVAGLGGSNLRHRKGNPDGTEPVQASTAANPEHVKVVKTILTRTSYYEILEVEKACSEEELKKSYRKLSLKVHPDKNQAPRAEEAFKVLSRAFQVLTDPELRANYDRYGHEDPSVLRQQQMQRQQRQSHSRRAYSNGFSHFYFDDDGFDPNDVFNAFFGMHHPEAFRNRQRAQRHRAARAAAAAAEEEEGGSRLNFLPLLQLLPLLLFFLLAFLPSNDPKYSLHQSEEFSILRTTSARHVPYFVKSHEFDSQYPHGSRQRLSLERQVESGYKDHLETRCYYERVSQAQHYRWGQYEKARSMQMPNCDKLQELVRAR